MRKARLFLGSWLILSLFFFNCTFTQQHCQGCHSTTNPAPRVPPQVIFLTTEGRRIAISVELACTPEEQQQGLMFRRSLEDRQGMLFVFPYEAIQSFWMKNTFIPLDMIHLDQTGKIVGIVENATPHDESSRSVGSPAKYVLEVNAFFAKKNNLHIGLTAEILGLPSGC